MGVTASFWTGSMRRIVGQPLRLPRQAERLPYNLPPNQDPTFFWTGVMKCGRALEPQARALVPKLCLGMHLGAKLCFAGGGVCGQATAAAQPADTPLHAKQSFARNGVPKPSLGTRTLKTLERWSKCFDRFDKRFDCFDRSIEDFCQIFDRIPKRFEGIWKSFDRFLKSFDRFQERFDWFVQSFDRFDKSFERFPEPFERIRKSFDRLVQSFAGYPGIFERTRKTFDRILKSWDRFPKRFDATTPRR
jgi:hypothetical protein